MECRAVLFDLDGTLLDTLADIAVSANQVLQDLDLRVHPIDAYKQFVGDGVQVLFTRALADARAEPELIARCMKAFRSAYAANWNRQSRPYNGILELLDGIESRRLKMAVLSNKPDEFTQLCVDEHFAERDFQVVMGQREGIPRKPDPTGALQIAKSLDVPPNEFVYVGDTATDMETARAAGMLPVGVRWGFRPAEELDAAGASTLIEHPLQLLDVIDRQLP